MITPALQQELLALAAICDGPDVVREMMAMGTGHGPSVPAGGRLPLQNGALSAQKMLI